MVLKSKKVILIIFLLGAITLNKIYSIYKLQKEYITLKNNYNISSQQKNKISVYIDGNESNYFPTIDDNYTVESVECTNGVEAVFDTKKWQLTIADISSSSTTCSIYFDSTRTKVNGDLPYNKEELIAINNRYQNIQYDEIKSEILDYYYPIGSIYISTEDDTVEKVEEKFGGTWAKYSEGRTLIGANNTYLVNSTGGSTTTTLSVANLPAHNHSYTPSGTVTSKFSGSAVNTNTTGNHAHTVYGIRETGLASGLRMVLQTDGNMVLYTAASKAVWSTGTGGKAYGSSYRGVAIGVDGTSSAAGNHYHSVTSAGTVTSSFAGTTTTTGNTGSGTAINVQNPFTTVYMYKRTA